MEGKPEIDSEAEAHTLPQPQVPSTSAQLPVPPELVSGEEEGGGGLEVSKGNGDDETANLVDRLLYTAFEYKKQAVLELEERNIGGAHLLFLAEQWKLLNCLALLQQSSPVMYAEVRKWASQARTMILNLERGDMQAMKHGQPSNLHVDYTLDNEGSPREANLQSQVFAISDSALLRADKQKASRKNAATASSNNGCGETSKNASEVAKTVFRVKLQEDSTKPKMKFSDIAGYGIVKDSIEQSVLFPRRMAELFGDESTTSAILFFGPSGCGKTIFAESLAEALSYSFLSVGLSDIQDAYIGGCVAKMKAAFEVARETGNCIIFFDEVETLLSDRTKTRSESSRDQVTEFLVQCNEVFRHNKMYPDKEVFLVAATNYPNSIDLAVWRRLQLFVHIPLPIETDRKVMLQHFLKECKFTVEELSEKHWNIFSMLTHGYSSADIENLSKDIKLLPKRTLCAATHFRKILPKQATLLQKEEFAKLQTALLLEKHQYPGSSLATMKTWDSYKAFHSKSAELFGVKYYPCSKHLEGALEMKVTDLTPDELQMPSVSAIDILRLAENRRPSQNVNDLEGSNQLCIVFNEMFGTKVMEPIKDAVGSETENGISEDELMKRAETLASEMGYKAGDDKSDKLTENNASNQCQTAKELALFMDSKTEKPLMIFLQKQNGKMTVREVPK